MNNLVTAVTTTGESFIIDGLQIKSYNAFYNKQKAHYQSILAKHGRYSSRRINEMGQKREQRINHYLHVASRRIIDLMCQEQMGVLVIGKNKNWKQAANMGSKNNQQFVQIPFARFIDMLTYKAKIAGIQVIIQEESYSSKCSFLDFEPVQKHAQYAGRRVKRGLFRASDGRTINADLNGSYNILRKAIPDAFCNGIEGVAVHPSRFILVN